MNKIKLKMESMMSVNELIKTQENFPQPLTLNELQESPIHQIPGELIIEIFSHLEPKVINGACSSVSKGWDQLTNDHVLWNAMSIPISAFGKEQWGRYFGGDVGEEPHLARRDLIKLLEGPDPFQPGKKRKETHMLVLVPKTMDEQQLTIGRLTELAESPKQGNKVTVSARLLIKLSSALEDEFSPTHSHWVLIADGIFPESKGKDWDGHQTFLAKHNESAQAQGVYKIPTAFQLTVCAIAKYVSTGVPFFKIEGEMARCQDCDPSQTLGLVVERSAHTTDLKVTILMCNKARDTVGITALQIV
jgi:hypothetical protein